MHKLYFISDIRKSNSSCQFFNGKKKYIATADVQNSKIVNFELVDFNNKPSRANLISEKGSVLFAKMQNTIKVLEINDDNCNNIYSTGFYSFKDERILPRYLRYFFESKLFNSIKDKNCQGATMKAINDDAMEKISINVPSINCQQIIIDKLFHINDLIKKNNFILERLDNIVKSQFIEMFSSYEKVKLCDLAEIIMGQSPNSKTYNDYSEGVPFFQGKADFGDKYTIVRHWTNKPIKIARKNSVLLSVRAPVGPVNLANEDCCIGRGLCSINALEKKTNNEFLYNALKIIEKELTLMGSGSTFKAINKNDVQNLIIPDAPYNKQIEYVNFISQIDKSKFIVQKQIDDLQELLDSKMDEYFG